MKKGRGLWPLPGGFGKYVDTLNRCLAFVKDEKPDENRLKQWFFKSFPQMKGERAVLGYIYTIKKLGFLKEEHRQYILTDEAEKFLETRDNKLLYRMMDERIAGVSDILQLLSKRPYSISELHQDLQRLLNVRWRTSAQVYWRLGWLKGMGYVTKVGRQYSLTDLGKGVVSKVDMEERPLPPTLPPPETRPSPHKELIDIVVELGEMFKKYPEPEYALHPYRYDVVWKRTSTGNPTKVFEIHWKGVLDSALAKLKHARDVWNAELFLVIIEPKDKDKANFLLTGSFHEISDITTIIQPEEIKELYKYKKRFRKLEEKLR